ncbi:MAG TPA: DUF5666 domain-containing protein [Candidatus Angelobacter sp.]
MKRVLFVTLFSVVFALAFALTGCGGSKNGPVQLTGTSTAVQFGDVTNDQIAKFELTVSSITLKGDTGTTDTANLLTAPVEFEFSHSAGAFEVVSLSKVPAGTYVSATLNWSNPEIATINNGVPTKITPSPTSGTVTITFASKITVGTTPTFLNFDLDLSKSLDLTKTPPALTPTFTVTATATPANQNNEDNGDGEDDDVHGKVTAINAPKFTIQTNAGTSIDFTTDSNTQFKDGITKLADLKTGDIVEVDAMTQSDGTKLATKVEREGGETGEEAEGLISALDNPLTKITIAHQVDSMHSASSPTTVDITVNAQTQYSVRSDKLGVTGTFDATHIGKGQRIEADSDGQASPIVARKVKLREQALVGTVSNATATTFTLTPSTTSAFASLSGATSVAVTIANGAKLQVTPTNNATVRVRGLVFVSGTTYTMTAVRVDNNQ